MNQALKLSVDDLLSQLQRSEGVLDSVARRLDDEFAERYNTGVGNQLMQHI